MEDRSQHPRPSLLDLPTEIRLQIVSLLDPQDVVTIRQICRVMYDLEKSFHGSVWKPYLQKMAIDSALFPPTFGWKVLSSKSHEIIARRAISVQSILHQYQGSKDLQPVPSHTLELPIFPGHNSTTVHSTFILPGGRFLLVINDTNLQIWDLVPYLTSHDTPALLHKLKIPSPCSGARAFTMAGSETTSVRLVLDCICPAQPSTLQARHLYGVTADEWLNVFSMHELSFEGDVPTLKKLGELAIADWNGSSEKVRRFFAFSDNRAAMVLQSKVILWNYIENTYAAWDLKATDDLPVCDVAIDTNRFYFSQSRQLVSVDIPSLNPLSSRTAIRLSTIVPSPAPNTVAKYLPGHFISRFHPFWGSRTAWGVMDTPSTVFPVRDFGAANPETHWYRITQRPEDKFDVSLVGRSKQLIPGPASSGLGFAAWISGHQQQCNGDTITASLWNTGGPTDVCLSTIVATIHPEVVPPEATYEPPTVRESVGVPLASLPMRCVRDWDFCPLFGIVVVVALDPLQVRLPVVRIYDFVHPL